MEVQLPTVLSIIGCITYDIKYANKLVSGDKYKLQLISYIKNKLGTDIFTKGFKNYCFNIFIEYNQCINKNEKGLSS